MQLVNCTFHDQYPLHSCYSISFYQRERDGKVNKEDILRDLKQIRCLQLLPLIFHICCHLSCASERDMYLYPIQYSIFQWQPWLKNTLLTLRFEALIQNSEQN